MSTVPPAELTAEYARLTWEALQPTALAMGVAFLALLGFNALTMPAEVRTSLMVADLVVVAGALGTWQVARRKVLTGVAVYPLAVAFTWLIVGDVLLAQWLTGQPLYGLYLAAMLVGMGALLLSVRALLVAYLGTVTPWIALAAVQVEPTLLADYAVAIATAVTFGAVIQHARRRGHRQVLVLRAWDRAQQDDLDQRVEQQTAQLRAARDELEVELRERERMEQEQQRLRAGLQRAQRVETVGRLAGGIAHDLNNGLTIITVSLETMRMLPGLPAAAGELLDAAEAATKRSAETIRQLLAYSRKQSLVQARLAPSALLSNVVPLLRKIAGARVTLRVEDSSGRAAVLGDAAALEQALLNLVINACDAMPDGGVVTLRAAREAVDAGRAEVHPGARPGPHVALSVEDTGVGMDPQTLERIFDPFFTTKELGQGTGLGLSLVDGIVAQHDGFIEVASTVGAGTTFTMLLPEALAAPVTEPARGSRLARSPRGTEAIVLVEDEPGVRHLASTVLRTLGYQVDAVADGAAALAHIAAAGAPPALVITDVVMPGIDGFALADGLREVAPAARVLFVSGYQREDLRRPGRELPERFLSKPYQVDELARAVRAALDEPAAAP